MNELTCKKNIFDINFILLLLFFLSINFSIALSYLFFTTLLLKLFYQFIKKDIKLPKLPFLKYYILFGCSTLISSFFSINPKLSFIDNKELFVLLLFPVTLIVINQKEKVKTATLFILVAATASSITGIVTSLIKGVSTQHRLKGLTSHWMTYSGLLMLSFSFLFFFYLERDDIKKKKIILMIPLSFILIALIASLTRSAWVGLLSAVTIYILIKNFKLIFILIPLLLLTYFILPQNIKNRVQSTIDIDNPSNKDRIHMCYTGFKIFKDYPWQGVGADMIKKVYPKYRHPDSIQNNPHLHNNLLQILAERGVFCGIIFILMIFMHIKALIKEYLTNKKDNFKRALSLSALLTFTSFLIAGFFEFNFGDTEIKFLLFPLIVLPFFSYNKEKEC